MHARVRRELKIVAMAMIFFATAVVLASYSTISISSGRVSVVVLVVVLVVQPSGKRHRIPFWCFTITIMSNRRQSYFLHSDRTWNARTPHMVAASSLKPAIKKHNHWSGPCERGRARQCRMKCSGFLRNCLDSAAQ